MHLKIYIIINNIQKSVLSNLLETAILVYANDGTSTLQLIQPLALVPSNMDNLLLTLRSIP